MKRKRVAFEVKKQEANEILNQKELRVTKEGNEYFFEIGIFHSFAMEATISITGVSTMPLTPVDKI